MRLIIMCCYIIRVLISYFGGSLLMVLFILYIYVCFLFFILSCFSIIILFLNWSSAEKLSFSCSSSLGFLACFLCCLCSIPISYGMFSAEVCKSVQLPPNWIKWICWKATSVVIGLVGYRSAVQYFFWIVWSLSYSSIRIFWCPILRACEVLSGRESQACNLGSSDRGTGSRSNKLDLQIFLQWDLRLTWQKSFFGNKANS